LAVKRLRWSFWHNFFFLQSGSLEPVNRRKQKTSQVLASFISVRSLTLAIAFSLVSPSAIPANALDLCAIEPNGAVCLTTKADSLQVIVNKAHPLVPNNYHPLELVRVPKYNPLGRYVRKEVSSAIVKLGNQMKEDGKGVLIVQSGFRSSGLQSKIHAAKVASLGKYRGENLAARAGYSEHQTGLAVDFGAQGFSTLQVSFAKTKACLWLAANSYKYGFVLRYPYGKTKITGYSFEPWHFRFVGVATATEMHDRGITTLEEFYDLPPAPKYLN
jgi:D-alanyl-D-alanine carboxypeptidase